MSKMLAATAERMNNENANLKGILLLGQQEQLFTAELSLNPVPPLRPVTSYAGYKLSCVCILFQIQ